MVRNPDPKPGRWILPLVVLGMVFFTWAFVQRLEPDVIADDTAISSTTSQPETGDDDPVDGDASPDETPDSTTATTLPPELDSFMADMVADQESVAVLASEMDAANTAWDNDEVEYGEAENSLIEIRDDAQAFRDSVVLRQAPAGYTGVGDGFQNAINAANDIAGFAEDVLDGLRASDTGQARRAALVEFRSAVEAFNQAVASIEEAASAAAG